MACAIQLAQEIEAIQEQREGRLGPVAILEMTNGTAAPDRAAVLYLLVEMIRQYLSDCLPACEAHTTASNEENTP
jgi:hypothetical protein